MAAGRFRREQPDLAQRLADTIDEVFDDSDAVVLVTKWAEYLDLMDREVAVSEERVPEELQPLLDRVRAQRSG